jgi:hypothetical protein
MNDEHNKTARPSIWGAMWHAFRQERNRQVKRMIGQRRG